MINSNIRRGENSFMVLVPGLQRSGGLVLVVLLEAQASAQRQVFRSKRLDRFIV